MLAQLVFLCNFQSIYHKGGGSQLIGIFFMYVHRLLEDAGTDLENGFIASKGFFIPGK